MKTFEKELGRILFERHKQPFHGFRTTLHFWEQFLHRFGNDVDVVSGLFDEINKQLCMLCFKAACSEDSRTVITFRGADIPLMLIEDGRNVFIKALTIYKHRDYNRSNQTQ